MNATGSGDLGFGAHHAVGLRAQHEVPLAGCSPTPLASYLKALGIFRLVAEQADPEARGFWRDEHFVLVSRLDEEDLCRFFLKTYRPTPIISPWNGRAGFLEGEGGEDSSRKGAVVVREISKCHGSRFGDYRTVLNHIREVSVIERLNRVRTEVKRLEALKKRRKGPFVDAERLRLAKTEERAIKSQLLTGLRAELAEPFIDWMDACLVVTEDDPVTTPLLGSGGNEGSMDYSINHLILLSQLIDVDTDAPTSEARLSIRNALLGEASVLSLFGNPGFLGPAGSGGPNMTSGFFGEVRENAWNMVLMLEGAIVFLATATRRLDSSISSKLSIPFVVDAVRSGHDGVSHQDSVRPEFWAPVWESQVSIFELCALLAEGRATLNGRAARDGLDMARSIAALGVHRGVSAFQRYGFFERRGRGYYVATPLNRVVVRRNSATQLLADLEQGHWLQRFRRLARSKNATQRTRYLVSRLEDAVFAHSTSWEDPARKTQRLLAILGEIQLHLGRSAKTRECPPVPWLSKHWLNEAQDGSDVLAIAAALAGIHASQRHGKRDSWLMPMRRHLAPESTARRPDWNEHAHHVVTWGVGSLEDNLVATLQRRLLEATTSELDDKPIAASRMAPLASVAAWLAGRLDSSRLSSLLPGLMLVRVPAGADTGGSRRAPLPAEYRVLKPFFCTNAQLARAGFLPRDVELSLPMELPRRIAAGDTFGALAIGVRRLRVAGVAIDFSDLASGITPGRRLLSALMVPIADRDLASLLSRHGGRETDRHAAI